MGKYGCHSCWRKHKLGLPCDCNKCNCVSNPDKYWVNYIKESNKQEFIKDTIQLPNSFKKGQKGLVKIQFSDIELNPSILLTKPKQKKKVKNPGGNNNGERN